MRPSPFFHLSSIFFPVFPRLLLSWDFPIRKNGGKEGEEALFELSLTFFFAARTTLRNPRPRPLDWRMKVLSYDRPCQKPDFMASPPPIQKVGRGGIPSLSLFSDFPPFFWSSFACKSSFSYLHFFFFFSSRPLFHSPNSIFLLKSDQKIVSLQKPEGGKYEQEKTFSPFDHN